MTVIGFGLILLRGLIYRLSINYVKLAERNPISVIDSEFREIIEYNRKAETELSIEQIIIISTQLTNKTLKFSMDKVSNDPNELINERVANCVGYASFFSTVANKLVKDEGLNNKYKIRHWKGGLELYGVDVHQYFENSFFKDHDFVEIQNLETGENIYIDPTVSDYLKIDRIKSKNMK